MVHVTHSTKPVSEKDINRQWHHIDVKGKVLGRVANEIASLLQGKHKTNYVPHLDMGDYVVVTNAKKVVITGSKEEDKEYKLYSGFPGGLRTVPYKTMLEKQPAEVIKRAVLGMLPKNKLRDRRVTRLFVFPEEQHGYEGKFK